MLGKLNLTIPQGASWRLPITWETEDATPEAIDLTGYTARMQIRKTDHAGKVLVELSSEGGSPNITLSGEDGGIELALTAVQTRALLPGDHVYDLELTAPNATVTRLLQGTATVDPEVTR